MKEKKLSGNRKERKVEDTYLVEEDFHGLGAEDREAAEAKSGEFKQAVI